MSHTWKQRRISILLALFVALGGVAACDREDVRDVNETIENVEEDAEEFGEEVEEQIDKMDTDGKDD